MASIPLRLYLSPPRGELDLAGFREAGKARVELLRALEDAERDKTLILRTMSEELKLDAKKDRDSHFVLRLALCSEDWQRRWLVRNERNLLSLRFRCAPQAEKDNFIDTYVEKFLTVNNEEKSVLKKLNRQDLKKEVGEKRSDFVSTQIKTIYKIPFERAFDLLARRSVILCNGFAYVPENLMFFFVQEWFQVNLNRHLLVLRRATQGGKRDSRLEKIISDIKSKIKKNQYKIKRSNDSGVLSRNIIPRLSRESFPLCMAQMHRHLSHQQHLRYWGRRTFGLFLKGIGLNLKEALDFWRESFSPRFSALEWRAKYSYNIKHNYGMAGKRFDYSPYECSKLFSNAPQRADEFHGCPFKYSDALRLRQILEYSGVGDSHMQEILHQKQLSNYGKACQLYFQCKHDVEHIPIDLNGIGRHPNAYYDKSREYYAIHMKKSGFDQKQ